MQENCNHLKTRLQILKIFSQETTEIIISHIMEIIWTVLIYSPQSIFLWEALKLYRW